MPFRFDHIKDARKELNSNKTNRMVNEVGRELRYDIH